MSVNFFKAGGDSFVRIKRGFQPSNLYKNLHHVSDIQTNGDYVILFDSKSGDPDDAVSTFDELKKGGIIV